MRYFPPLFTRFGFLLATVATAFGQADTARTERVLAAVETFETKFRALENLASCGEPAGELMGVFARELPAPIASNLASGIADFVNKHGGLEAFVALVEHAPEHYAASLPSVLSANQQELLALRQAIAKLTARAPDDWAKRTATWATAPRGRRGPKLATENLDLRSVRVRAVMQGNYGAIFDLGIASGLGLDTPVDGDLVYFWGALGSRIDRAQALKIGGQPKDSLDSFRAAAEAGSSWGMVKLAVKLLPDDTSPIPPGEARAWLEKAAALGFTASASYLKWRGLAVSPAPPPAVAATAAPPIPPSPTKLAPDAATIEQTALAALVQLESALLTSPNYDAVKEPAEALIKTLDRLSNKRAADAVATAVLEFLRRHGGASDYYEFQMALTGERFAAAHKFNVARLSSPQKVTLSDLADQTVRKSIGATV